jgi:four helix bundle protein
MSRITEEFRSRTKANAASVVRLYVGLPHARREVEVLGHQLLRSGTSVAANVREASRARTEAEFASKLDIAITEADESLLWLELLAEECGITSESVAQVHRETGEILAILVSIVSKVRANLRG